MHIQVKFNYNSVKLSEHGVVSGKAICGSSVELLLKDGSTVRLPFGGFRDFIDPKIQLFKPQFVKVINVQLFYSSSEPFTKPQVIEGGHYCIGLVENGKVFLYVRNEQLMTRPLPSSESVKLADTVVVKMSDYKRSN